MEKNSNKHVLSMAYMYNDNINITCLCLCVRDKIIAAILRNAELDLINSWILIMSS